MIGREGSERVSKGDGWVRARGVGQRRGIMSNRMKIVIIYNKIKFLRWHAWAEWY